MSLFTEGSLEGFRKSGNLDELESLYEKLSKVRNALSDVIFGQDIALNLAIVSILSGGHLILSGPPGVAKNFIAKNLSLVFGLESRNFLFAEDSSLDDFIGYNSLPENSMNSFIKGDLFCQLFLAEYLETAPPKVINAIIKAMQQRFVLFKGKTFDLPSPFHVIATRLPTPVDEKLSGVIDNFLMQIDIPYPDQASEKQLLITNSYIENKTSVNIMTAKELLEAQKTIRKIPVGEKIMDFILKLVKETRPETSSVSDVINYVFWGAGTNASKNLLFAARAKALFEGRLSPSFDDVLSLAKPILSHRLSLNPKGKKENIDTANIIKKICSKI